MDERINELERENLRLLEALRRISEHQKEIQKILDGISDILYRDDRAEGSHVTDEDVKSLLKKYSRI